MTRSQARGADAPLPPAYAPSSDTKKTANAIFLHPANLQYRVSIFDVPGHAEYLQDLVPAIAKWLRTRYGVNCGPLGQLILYKPTGNIALMDGPKWARDHAENIDAAAEILSSAWPLSMILGNEMDSQYVNLVILIGNQTDEERDVLKSLSKPGYYGRFSELRHFPKPPSAAATSKERQKLQANSATRCYDGGCVIDESGVIIEACAQPVDIFFPPFAQVAAVAQDSSHVPSAEILNLAGALMSQASIIYQNEQDYEKNIVPCLQNILGRIDRLRTASNFRPDGLITFKFQNLLVSLVVLEYKHSSGEGYSDSMVQAEYSALCWWNRPEFEGILSRCCGPTLLLSATGARVAISGLVYTDRLIVQRLTPMISMATDSTATDARLYEVARLFDAISIGIGELRNFYENLLCNYDKIEPAKPGQVHPRYFPRPTMFQCRETGQPVEFTYTKAVVESASNLTYLAKTLEDPPRSLIVKFSDRYGYEPHAYLADLDYAPKLYYCGLLDGKHDVRESEEARGKILVEGGGIYLGPRRMVVMEDLGRRSALDRRETWPQTARTDIEKALQLLHTKEWVFGDLRHPNVVFVGERAKLVDFDWSGKRGEAFYPFGLSTSVKWPKKLEELEHKQIQPQHDLDMLEMFFA